MMKEPCWKTWILMQFLVHTLAPLVMGDIPLLEGKVIPGIYWEESPQQPILYEKVIPLVFEFKVRSELWAGLPLGFNRFKILPRLTCRSDNKSSPIPISMTSSLPDWTFTCPVFYHLHEFLRQFKANYTDINPLFRPGLRQTFNAIDYQKFSHHSSLHFDDCEQLIARQWKGIYGRELGLGEYRTIVEKCNTLPSYFEEQIQDYNNDGSSSGSSFEAAKDNFLNYFINNSNQNQGELINNLLGLQGLHLLNTVSELTRLREAQLACQNQLIPYSFLKTSRLEKTLGDLKGRLLPLKYIIPNSLSVSKLLKLPLADCIFTPNALTVQILLPVIRVESNFHLLRFNYPSFLYKEQLCSVKSVHEVSRIDQPISFLYDRQYRTLIQIQKKDCDSDRNLCQAPDRSQRPPLNKCIYELLNASFHGIRKHCWLHCEKLEPEYKKVVLPTIQRVSPSRFIITVDRITTMLIKCEGRHDELISPQAFGAVEISLACNCHIMYHSERFYARAPCGSSLIVKHVIPEHMINGTLINSNKFTMNQLADKVNTSLIQAQQDDNDNITLLELNNNDNGDFSFQDKNNSINNVTIQPDLDNLLILPTIEAYHEACFKTHVYLWFFIVAESLLCIILIVILYLKLNTLTKKLDYGRSAVCFSVSQMTNLDDK